MTDQQFYEVLSRSMPDYTPVEKIGAGSFGSVYKCERDGIYYAIKIIPVPGSDDELKSLLSRYEPEEVQNSFKDKVEKYRKEIMLMSELKGNGNIVNIEDYKIIEDDKKLGYYIVIRMELLKSLVDFAGRGGLKKGIIIRLGIDICDALSICEKHGIIHRDIKPENIMLHNDGAFKLGDFGIAKQLSQTATGTLAGTDGFMAPEVSRGLEYNHTADIYSLGILLYYYLNNGKMPFVAPDNKSIIAEQEAIAKRMNTFEALPFPEGADENLAKVIVKAAMFDKDCRYQSADEMKADLLKVMKGEEVEVDLSGKKSYGMYFKDTRYEEDVASPFSGTMIGPKPSKGSKETKNTKPTEEIAPPKKKKKKKAKTILALVGTFLVLAIVAVGALMLMGYINEQPITYVDEAGNEVLGLSRNQMADAYEAGVAFYEEGNYENAIIELGKVTDRSSKYADAQTLRAEAMVAYTNKIVEQSNAQLESGNYEAAIGIVESGMAIIGDDAALYTQVKTVFDTLKADMLSKATSAEEAKNYAEAFSFASIAAAFLPEDAEVNTIYTRLFAMSTMETALAEAEEYIKEEDYAMAFSTLEDALEKAAGTQVAESKLSAAYDSYKKDYVSSVEKLAREAKASLDFDEAVKALATAAEIFEDDNSIQDLYKEISDLDTAHTAINSATSLAESGNYEKLFKDLNAALDKVDMGSEAEELLSASFETHKETFMTMVNEQIGDPKTISEYDAAIKAVETAIKTFGGDAELESKLSELKEYKPVSLFSKNYVDAKYGYGSSASKCSEYSMESKYYQTNQFVYDNYGSSYTNSSVLTAIRGYYDYCFSYVSYDCKGYKNLSGIVALLDTSKSYKGGPLKLVVYGCNEDMSENVIYKKDMVSGIRPQKIDVNIEGYSMVKIYIYSNSGNMSDKVSVILSDFSLSKK